MTTKAAPSGAASVHSPVSVTGWNALLCFAAAFAIVICAIGIRSEVYEVLNDTGFAVAGILLLAKLFLPERYASFDREATRFWLGGFASLCIAYKATMRYGETGDGFFTFAAICGLTAAIPLLVIAHRKAQLRAGSPGDRDLMLTGASLIVIAYVSLFLSTLCPSGMCAYWPDPNVWWIMLPPAGWIVYRELRGLESTRIVPAVLAGLAVFNALFVLQVRFGTFVSCAGTAILAYDVVRRTRVPEGA